ncbi:glycosyl hydrolase [Compostibacter hankyongensis]|uniref:Glycosyl hydrolase n=1 Tax=Compostibacter hankyongensis TaxID=1007089 RepID=A0ABP8FIE9_9BACT
MHIDRRRFIKLGSLTAAGLPLIGMGSMAGMAGCKGETAGSAAERYRAFRDPDSRFRPFVRWWWNGDRLQEREILRELDILKAAGIGGVEINPIRFPDEADPLDIKSLEWLSDEWIAMLQVALKGAKEKGLTCDMIVGSGWPYGGEFLSREDQTQMIALGTRNLKGGKTYRISAKELLDGVNPDFHSKYKDPLKALAGLTLVPASLKDISACTDLSGQLGQDEITVEVPPGEHVLYYLVKLTGFMAVINGAPGAGGPVLNHYSKPAVEKYLNRMSDRLKARIGPLGNSFRAFFTDSFELEGANWCTDMFEEFRKRKGYDLAPYFPFILFKTGEMGNAVRDDYGAKPSPELQQTFDNVRYDFEDTRQQLFKERFIDTFTDWCKKNGVKSRMQAYGRPCNPVEAGMDIDLPECETWMSSEVGKVFSDEDYRRGRAYTLNNKFVSSSAHLSGRRLISCEEMTNTGMVFNATLENIKITGDQSILTGVTHSVLHGFNYSPLEAPFPGWIRYGTFFNERNTWWPYFRKWSDYKARLYALLQQSEMQADVALLPPLADLSMRFGFQRDPFPSFAYPPYVYQVWEAVHQDGGGCDYVTERILQQSSVKDGRLTYGTRSYKALLLIDVESLLPETADRLRQFVKAGGKLVCIGRAPQQTPSLQSSARGAVDILKDADPAHAGIVPAPEKDFISWYRGIRKRFGISSYLDISNPDRFVSQVYYRDKDADIFFFSNYHAEKSHRLKTTFPVKGRKAWLWDPETGQRFLFPASSGGNTWEIPLGPAESKLIVFDPQEKGEQLAVPPFGEAAGTALDGPWKLTLHSIDGSVRSLTLDALVDFSTRDELKNFGGTAVYEQVFRSAENGGVRYLSLGAVHGVAEITINGEPVGTQWYGRPVHDISKQVKPGDNQLRIKLVTTLGNHLKSLTDNKVAQVWTRHQPLYPGGLTGPVRIS